MVLTRPISEVQDTTMVLGTVVDNLTREVMLIGRLGRFGSTPFLVGGRNPYTAKTTKMVSDQVTHITSLNGYFC